MLSQFKLSFKTYYSQGTLCVNHCGAKLMFDYKYYHMTGDFVLCAKFPFFEDEIKRLFPNVKSIKFEYYED